VDSLTRRSDRDVDLDGPRFLAGSTRFDARLPGIDRHGRIPGRARDRRVIDAQLEPWHAACGGHSQLELRQTNLQARCSLVRDLFAIALLRTSGDVRSFLKECPRAGSLASLLVAVS